MSEERTVIVRLRALGYAAILTRFNLFILLAGFVLLYIDQGQDLLLKISEDNHWGFLFGGGLFWALNIWYWARELLEIRFPDPPVNQSELAWWRTHLPRILGVAAFATLALNLYRATGFSFYVVAVVLLACVFYFGVFHRRKMARRLAGWTKKDNPQTSRFWLDDIDNSRSHVHGCWQDDIKQVWSKLLVKFTTFLGLTLFAWGMISPLTMGLKINTLVLMFLWGATFLPIGSLITYIGSRKGYPLFTLLLVLAFVFSSFNDNHRIRELGETKPRPSLEAALDQWTGQHNCENRSCPPLVIVATAGGGIRAAYWTGTVLGNLDDELAQRHQKALRDNLFAISGVSGGSVGAAVYRAALETDVPARTMMESVQTVLSKDFLAPLAAGLLYRDFLQRFMPVDTFEDRATTFEEGLETGFKEYTQQDTMQRPFTSLTGQHAKKPWPALFLNSTWSDNGRRIVAAGFKLADDQRLYTDLLDSLGYDLRLSTAAHNSARFPFASPPGSWKLALSEEQKKIFHVDSLRQRLQDGGLFENYGAETALEILRAAEKYFSERKLYFDPMVVLISSDPTLPEDLAEAKIKKPMESGYEVLTTFRTYGATRVGRGAEAASRLENEINRMTKAHNPGQHHKRFANFRMCGAERKDSPPLGWALSEKAQRTIKGYLLDSKGLPEADCRKANQEARSRVLYALAGK